uniref:Uncharacterized protein isoform X2 n=1 Tax=Nicotiana tabacum TaxID=4097 RepID=A0A1S4BAY4_TOBAC|nr:PREDICTED: uncharacterized protein LOC107806413 isoform X2 [Nicotiana tabacum]
MLCRVFLLNRELYCSCPPNSKIVQGFTRQIAEDCSPGFLLLGRFVQLLQELITLFSLGLLITLSHCPLALPTLWLLPVLVHLHLLLLHHVRLWELQTVIKVQLLLVLLLFCLLLHQIHQVYRNIDLLQ